jgi:8-oxo-dGTP pyrophosphatase MutT (NUDIX family)
MSRHLTRTAVFVVLEKDNQVFLLRRANTGWADGLLTLPAGHVDKGDSVIYSALKETKEEAGVTIEAADLEFIHVDYLLDEYVNFYFRATKWEGEPTNVELDKASEGVWCDKWNLPDDLIPAVKNLFTQVTKGNYFSEGSR